MPFSSTYLPRMPEDRTEASGYTQHLGPCHLHTEDSQASHLTCSHRTEPSLGGKT